MAGHNPNQKEVGGLSEFREDTFDKRFEFSVMKKMYGASRKSLRVGIIKIKYGEYEINNEITFSKFHGGIYGLW
jgi:hypothetical protein